MIAEFQSILFQYEKGFYHKREVEIIAFMRIKRGYRASRSQYFVGNIMVIYGKRKIND